MESEAKRYEISYLVSPNVAEDDVVRVAGTYLDGRDAELLEKESVAQREGR